MEVNLSINGWLSFLCDRAKVWWTVQVIARPHPVTAGINSRFYDTEKD